MAENDDNVADIEDISKSDWIRGVTPEDIKERCLQLCSDYLGSVWTNLSVDQIVVNRLTGGLTNQLYYCGIDDKQRDGNEEHVWEVAVRLYGPKHFNNEDKNERLSDIIIGLILSEQNLGPKLYGLFENGEIIKFYKVLYS